MGLTVSGSDSKLRIARMNLEQRAKEAAAVVGRTQDGRSRVSVGWGLFCACVLSSRAARAGHTKEEEPEEQGIDAGAEAAG
eukprot:scaffold13947_cov108-Isochrysis_galbana.AAC.1